MVVMLSDVETHWDMMSKAQVVTVWRGEVWCGCKDGIRNERERVMSRQH